jgi:hypothetical protein
MKIAILLLFLALAVAGCRDTPPVAAAQESTGTFTADSTRARELAEFRAGLTEVTELTHGAGSLDSLAREIVAALVTQDRARLDQLALTRQEFAWLYYPTTPQSRPPYDLDPATMWLTTEAQSGKGLGRAMERLQGTPVVFEGIVCEGTVSVEGENRVRGPCTITLGGSKAVAGEGRLFGLVIERHGQWKVVSYTNRLD